MGKQQENVKCLSVSFPDASTDFMWKLVDAGIFSCRAEIVRIAIRTFLRKQPRFLAKIAELSKVFDETGLKDLVREANSRKTGAGLE